MLNWKKRNMRYYDNKSPPLVYLLSGRRCSHVHLVVLHCMVVIDFFANEGHSFCLLEIVASYFC